MERSLVLIKPDAVERNLIGSIIQVYEDSGLKVIDIRIEQITEEFAKLHYKEHEGKSFFESLIKYITRSPLVAMVLEGENAIEVIRHVNGATDPNKAEEGTIRRLFALNKSENSVHASDSIESAKREINIWFPNL
ncbi:nucleoside diphosphate kinase [Clostridium cavendishii DSM 21758]|uniref:Nucleoside diphosphate kinase n=1 Tax=Clostridium cavendishii DSM 21758 TaxID=1121302 RepID=A0A1M6AH58_9CLOT|nr:nucleoside-diphosphate kinase [Clostridium cavendishii]SHI35795.1 nucleoside diphosphate kinase [Clostridium cavendishii DSM 21758]